MPETETQVNETTRRVTLLVATVASFLAPLMMSSANIALPSIARELRMDAVLLTWVPMVYIAAGAIFLLPFGKLADIYGRKKVFAYGIAVFTASSVLCGLSRSAGMLIFFRVFQGIGGSMIFGNAVAILMSVFPLGERGKVLGFSVGAVYVGLSVGPFVGGLLTQHLGWRSVFFMCGPLGCALLALIFTKLKGEWAEAKGERLDVAGSAVYSLALVILMCGFYLLPNGIGFLLLLVGIAGLFLFVRREMAIENPVLDLRLFRHNRVFALSNLAMFINYGASYSISFLISLYLQHVKHLSPQNAGLILISQPVMQAVFSPYAGKLSDTVEPQVVASCGMALTAIGLIIFSFLSEGTALWVVAAALALHGFGVALFSSPNTNAIMESVEKRFYGVAAGVASTMRLLGNSFSIGVGMFVFAVYIGRVEIAAHNYPAFLTSLRTIFSIFVVLCLCGVFASLARGKMR